MPSELHCFHRRDAIESRLGEWIAFSDRCCVAAPFCGPRVWSAWLLAQSDSAPAVYEWRRGGELYALLPMVRRGSRLEMAGALRIDYQDLAALDHESAVALLCALIAAESNRRSAFVFPQVAAGSRLAEGLADRRVADDTHLKSRFWSRCPVVSIPRRGDLGFEASLPSRQRKNFRNATRRLFKAFPDALAEHYGPGSFEPSLIDEVAALHVANQHRKKGASVFGDPSFLAVLKALASGESPLCLSLLRERPGAAAFAFHLGWFDGATYYDYLTAYAGEHAQVSPGRWLLVAALGHWHALGTEDELRLDLLCGEEPYKSHWSEESYLVSRVVLIPKRLANLPRILAYATVYGLKNAKNRRRGCAALRQGSADALECGGTMPPSRGRLDDSAARGARRDSLS